MLTQEQNERLTRVGPGTPCGELLRRYWQPLCPSGEITPDEPKKRVRILDEDLLVYRGADGAIACIAEHCAHRSASLFYGFIEPGGIRCCYHGWKYDARGKCIERPFESCFGNARLRAYPVQELGGLFFTYMGPNPASAPLLPRWDVLARDDGKRTITLLPVHECNWLQIQESAVDSVHTYFLHGHMSAVHDLPATPQARHFYRPIKSYDWGISEWGIDKSLVYEGDPPEIEILPPLIFPNILRISEGPVEALHFRVPIDDTHTRIICVSLRPSEDGSSEPAGTPTPFLYEPDRPLSRGVEELRTFHGRDRVVWETQGRVFDRSQEILSAPDRGIVLYRRMLAEQIDRVGRGEPPTVAVVRDPAKNALIVFESATRAHAGNEKHIVPARKGHEVP